MFCLFPFSNIKKAYLQISIYLAQFFCLFPFQILKKTILTKPSSNFCLFLIQILKKEYLQILKNLTQFFCSYPFQILRILKNISFYANNNLHKNHYANNSQKNYCKHKAKYIIPACSLIIIIII